MAGQKANRAEKLMLSPAMAVAVAVALVTAVAAVDALAPANVLACILYGVALIVLAWARSLRLLWGMTALAVLLTLGLFWLGPPPTPPATAPIALFNRCLSAGVMVVLAVLLHLRILSQHILDGQREDLERQNAELEKVNDELSRREEEIVRQNEELQSQTEELERQTEELRITNEELANREKTLEHLLELSRALTAETTRDAMLQRVCDELGVLTQGNAAAILEKRDDELALVCYHGFGPDGPRAEAVPFAGSFTALVLSRGQTGYLEDLTLRPDLRVPAPKHGEPFRSVLSAPLKVQNRAVGAVEVYAHQRQQWTEAQIALVESLAAQASISLQSAELIAAISQERRRFEAVFRTVPFGIAVAEDLEMRAVRLNPAAAALFNLPVGENVSPHTPAGARLRRHVLLNDRLAGEEDLPLARALRGEEVQGEEYEYVMPTGKRVTLLASAAPVEDAEGRIVGAVCGYAEVTALKQLQRELELRRREAEEASVRKTRFLAAVSHDIRTPANAINLMAEVIRRAGANPALASQVPDLARSLQANALSLVELVSDVLDIARFDTGKVDLQESEFLLRDLLADEARQLLPLAQDKGLSLTVEAPDRPVWLRTDRVKLGRVVGNLVGNAIKFTEAGSVKVEASLTPDRELALRVADTGVGIAPDYLGYVFDEFAQLRNPERDASKGTGLGLAICKRLVEVMGGTIKAESTPGLGSAFTVTLPPSCVLLRLDVTFPPSGPSPRPESLPAQGPQLAGLRVLLVEDHGATRQGTAEILRSEGAHVAEAPDGRSALAFLNQERFDALLLDMMLPDIDGREVLKAILAERPPGLRAVLVLTGDLTAERLEEIKRLGADAVIGKPIDVAKLVAALEAVRERGPGG